MDLFGFYADLPRIEPGGVTFSSAYLSAITIKSTDVVAELGSGLGSNATWIARSRCCPVVAVDPDPRCLKETMRRAEEGGGDVFVRPVRADLASLPFQDQAFKVVVSEGAALSLGLKHALTVWRRILAPGGILALTYPGVVNKGAPTEVRGPLERRMAEPMGTLADYHAVVRGAGFELVHQVSMQPELWESHYNDCVRHAWALMRSERVSEEDPTIRRVLDEARWYRNVGRGRVFYVAMVLRRVQ
ncbi:MAG: class I SAM-dependent methyltransferase [Bradymonadia bacterium]